MSVLSVNNVSKKFDSTEVLSSISFDLSKGEFFSVLGPSGCGKTTLLRIISGLEFPTEGKIYIEGIDSTSLPPQKRNVGIVFQNYALFPNMNVFQNVAYGLEVRKLPRSEIEMKVNSALEKVRMKDKSSRNVTLLSGGEQQRVSLARVIVTEPMLLLFDEPLSNLDYSLRLEARNEIKRLQKEIGITSVYVTHDQSEALALSDRLAVLNKGKLQQTGTPAEIYFNPANSFVADFIGHANFFDPKSAHEILGIEDASDNEILGIYPEDISPEKCTNECFGVIEDIQFSGLFTEYLISAKGKQIKSVISGAGEREFKTGEKVALKFDPGKVRRFRK